MRRKVLRLRRANRHRRRTDHARQAESVDQRVRPGGRHKPQPTSHWCADNSPTSPEWPEVTTHDSQPPGSFNVFAGPDSVTRSLAHVRVFRRSRHTLEWAVTTLGISAKSPTARRMAVVAAAHLSLFDGPTSDVAPRPNGAHRARTAHPFSDRRWAPAMRNTVPGRSLLQTPIGSPTHARHSPSSPPREMAGCTRSCTSPTRSWPSPPRRSPLRGSLARPATRLHRNGDSDCCGSTPSKVRRSVLHVRAPPMRRVDSLQRLQRPRRTRLPLPVPTRRRTPRWLTGRARPVAGGGNLVRTTGPR